MTINTFKEFRFVSDAKAEGVFIWNTSALPVQYTNWIPNAFNSKSTNCVQLTLGDSRQWSVENCNSWNYVVCQRGNSFCLD